MGWLPGGFLGVDAFFVLSGFLITSLLLAEYSATGRVALRAFWLRRARRLLPALLAVVITTVLVFHAVLPPDELRLLRGDAYAALGYVANWRMIFRGSDYFAQTASPSPLQHTWSLGIEEQFYLLWPLLLVALLGWLWRRRFGLRALALLCLAGAAASAIEAWLLYDPTDTGRAYFGTDTRAQALLVGCALAAVLFHHSTSTGRSSFFGVLAGLGLVVLAWLWSHATGQSGWLFHGGLSVDALAVAVVLGFAVTRPLSWLARVLALAPLVWLGRISYGVYLWHWPLYAYLDGERTHLAGTPLLAVRVGATLLLAIASYTLIEQPIRTRRLPLPRLAKLAVAATAVASVVAVSTVATRPSTVDRLATLPSPSPLSTGAPHGPQGKAAAAGPMHRPGRLPGVLPRVVVYGDSVAWTLGTYLPTDPSLAVTVRAVQGCGISPLPDVRYVGELHTNYPGCTNWVSRWGWDVRTDDPDVALILLDRWELMDRELNGVWTHVGNADYDAYLRQQLDRAVTIVGSRGAHVVLLTAPYTHRAEQPDGSLWPEDEPSRVDAWNALLRDEAAAHPGQVSVLDLNARVCPGGVFTWSIGGLQIRSDGLHFTPEGVAQWIAPWLLPQLQAIATG